MSAPTEEHWKKMTKLVDAFYNRPDSEPFREPVDWKAYGLLDYPKLIKHPMDLGTIRNKLSAGKREYKTLFQVGDDVRLVWTNCMAYNQDGSDFYKLADALHKKWDDKYTKLLAECPTATSTAGAGAGASFTNPVASSSSGAGSGLGAVVSGNEATLKEKRDFAKSLYSLSKEVLGKVLMEVDLKCPAALSRNGEESEVELNIDKIPASVLQDITKEVIAGNVKEGGSKSSNKKKAKLGTISE